MPSRAASTVEKFGGACCLTIAQKLALMLDIKALSGALGWFTFTVSPSADGFFFLIFFQHRTQVRDFRAHLEVGNITSVGDVFFSGFFFYVIWQAAQFKFRGRDHIQFILICPASKQSLRSRSTGEAQLWLENVKCRDTFLHVWKRNHWKKEPLL